MIDYMEPGCVGLPKYPSNMGMSSAYNMGSPSCSIENAAAMSQCVNDNFNHRMQPRTSTSTTESILNEIGSSDTLYNSYSCSGQGYMTSMSRAANGVATVAPTSKAMADLPVMTAPSVEMTQILNFDNQTLDENPHVPQFTKNDTAINQDVFTSVMAMKRDKALNHSFPSNSLRNNTYLEVSSANRKDVSAINNSTSNFNSAPAADLYTFPTTGNTSVCYERITSPIPISSCLSKGIELKEEPAQIVPQCPSSSMVSPIDMEHQEVIKTERKRQRNRVAASKCRKRKLERIARLEDKVNALKNQNLELSNSANTLRQQVADLKSKVMSHVRSGCQLMMGHHQQLSTYYDSTTVL